MSDRNRPGPAKGGERNIKLLVAYDGSSYCGWQRQKDRKSVQGEIEAALEKIHGHPAPLTGAGRTDSGVHAAGQTANFYSSIKSMDPGRFRPALNGLLPASIRVLDSREVPPDFHARFDARSRSYRYFFVSSREVSPREKQCALVLKRRPDIALLNAYARLFRGEFDCRVFAVPRDLSKSRSRHIYGAYFFMEGQKLVFEIRANAFLWKMVRSIAGTILFYEERKIPPEEFRRVIVSGKRELAGPTLPPDGLFLWQVEY
ncbi:MAG: tRNA pseudouridine(38-40) synthase TruA [Treponema sp.]|jgi:tRNA pseudouridine38-40 synthase|nr:tRNA pseudouridine(38-40) synthase TruA [Treponema sp.]